ncbi:low temperature requirement protein A [Micromonospora sp. WMMD1120]|uniref:low temperature requirement protein A n=1 Tax=Micromonospora sp. WMMD1120 TaxID=3016106 RepID=UPI0024174D54|nr:low temperature requirement protein A [Micromonospora sp. WMMD1120]MDG4810113.1 low temperature requirement protein A [Micromonospora sp. WMMD1120]
MTRSEPSAGAGLRARLLRPRHGVQPTTSTELFFDLVFIFTITQLSHYLIAHLDWRGVGRTALLLALVWLVWVYTTWVTNWLQPDQGPVRAMLLGVTLGSLLLSAAIPQAFGATGLLFAVTYVSVQVGRTAFGLWAVRDNPWLVAGFRQSLPWIAGTSVVMVLGGLVGGAAREALWTAVVVLEVVGLSIGYPLPGRGRSRPERWMVEGGHLAERCAAFVLIALGESILITGSTLTQHVDLVTSGAFLLAFAGSVALWWVYFARSAPSATQVIASAGERTGALSRVAFNYLHQAPVAACAAAAVLLTVAVIVADRWSGRAVQSRGPRSPLR